MHTTTVNVAGKSFFVNHNSDWSGDAHLHWTDADGKHRDAVLPGQLILGLSRSVARDELVNLLEEPA